MGMAVLGVAVAVVGVVNRNPNETLKSLKKMLFLHLDLRLRIELRDHSAEWSFCVACKELVSLFGLPCSDTAIEKTESYHIHF